MTKDIIFSKFTKGVVLGIPYVGATLHEWLYGESGPSHTAGNENNVSSPVGLLQESKFESASAVKKSYNSTIRIFKSFVRKYHALKNKEGNYVKYRIEHYNLPVLMKSLDKFVISYQKSYIGLIAFLHKMCQGDVLNSRLKRLNNLHEEASVSHETSLKLLCSISCPEDLQNHSFGTVEKCLYQQHDIISVLSDIESRS